MDELQKIDLIRSRMNIGYKEAREALAAAGGDVVKALIYVEETEGNFSEKLHSQSSEFMDQVRGVLRKGQDTRIKIRHGDRTVMEFPASFGVVGLLGALASSELAILGALGTVTAMAKKYSLEIERKGEREEHEGFKKYPVQGEI